MENRTHELKIFPIHFQYIMSGKKRFELRKDDRNFQEGDILILREWLPLIGYTGLSYEGIIKFVLRDVPEHGLKDGYCIFGW